MIAGLCMTDVRHDKWLQGDGHPPLLRMTHVPTGLYVERHRPLGVSVFQFQQRMIEELAELVRSRAS